MKRALLAVGGLMAAATLIGLLHLPALRPVLGLLGWAPPGCPVSLEGANPETVEAYRRAKVHERGGARLPLGTQIFGLELGVAGREETLEHARGRGWSCTSVSKGSVLDCQTPGIEIRLQFGSHRLVAVDAWHAPESAPAALRRLARIESQAERGIGPATHRTGKRDVAFLRARPLRRAGSDYRYAGYVAKISATNFGKRGVRVREQYQWAPPES